MARRRPVLVALERAFRALVPFGEAGHCGYLRGERDAGRAAPQGVKVVWGAQIAHQVAMMADAGVRAQVHLRRDCLGTG